MFYVLWFGLSSVAVEAAVGELDGSYWHVRSLSGVIAGDWRVVGRSRIVAGC
jgi:hypothetical protein